MTKYLALVLLIGCTSSLDKGDDVGVGIGGDGSSGGTGEGGSEGSQGSGNTIPAGQLTAGEWDDNRNFDWFRYTRAHEFAPLVAKAQIPIDGRLVVTITDGDGYPISNARVELVGSTTTLVAGSDGRVLLLPAVDGAHALHIIAPNGASVSSNPQPVIIVPGASAVLPTELDVAFVVDATGSMGDEIQYLQAEIADIAQRVTAEHPNVPARFALIVYRDTGDAYVTRTFDFANLAAFQSNLNAQSAGGGGDYPEAAEIAMREAMADLSWRTSNVARMVFQVADAPPHDPAFATFLDAALAARTKGIRIFPVAASGAAFEAEYLMRTAAFATLGRYIFLTDDSGIGNSHEPPRIPCYRVELLNNLLVRTVRSELAGQYLEPAEQDVLDVVGNYVDGTCYADEAVPSAR